MPARVRRRRRRSLKYGNPARSTSAASGAATTPTSAIEYPTASSLPNRPSVSSAVIVPPRPMPVRLTTKRYTAETCPRSRFGVTSCSAAAAGANGKLAKNTSGASMTKNSCASGISVAVAANGQRQSAPTMPARISASARPRLRSQSANQPPQKIPAEPNTSRIGP